MDLWTELLLAQLPNALELINLGRLKALCDEDLAWGIESGTLFAVVASPYYQQLEAALGNVADWR